MCPILSEEAFGVSDSWSITFSAGRNFASIFSTHKSSVDSECTPNASLGNLATIWLLPEDDADELTHASFAERSNL